MWTYKILVGKYEGKWPLGRHSYRQTDIIYIHLKLIGQGSVDRSCMAQGRDQWWALVKHSDDHIPKNLENYWHAEWLSDSQAELCSSDLLMVKHILFMLKIVFLSKTENKWTIIQQLSIFSAKSWKQNVLFFTKITLLSHFPHLMEMQFHIVLHELDVPKNESQFSFWYEDETGNSLCTTSCFIHFENSIPI